MLCTLIEEANRKGYSGQFLCDCVNQRGIKCHINTFRRAIKDGITRTEHQDRVYKLAKTILDELPPVTHDPNRVAREARRAGLTVKKVWERYNTTHGRKYVYSAFLVACRRCQAPFEKEIVREALKIIDILREENGQEPGGKDEKSC